MNHLRRLSFVVVAAALSLLAACTPGAPTAGGSISSTREGRGEVLHIGTTADVGNYNPLVGTSRSDFWVTNLMYPTLMTITADASLEPSLAKDWGYSKNGLSAWVDIRDDMKWSDGVPVTADDVAFTLETGIKENIGIIAGLAGSSYKSVKAVSPIRLEFTLSHADGTYLNNLGAWMPIVPKHVFGKAASVSKFPNDHDWVSAGPFKLVKAERGQRYVMDRVTPYPLAPGGVPTLKQVVFNVYPDVNAEMLALRNGDIDVIANAIPPAQVKSLAGDDIELTKVPTLGWAHIQFNTKRGALAKLKVRQALTHAVDYSAIRKVVLQGQAASANGSVLTPTLPFWEDPSIKEWNFDPGEARKMLEAAGYRDANSDGKLDGLSFEMIYDQADPNIAAWAQLVRDSFAQAGVQLKLAGLESNTYLGRADARDFDIYAGSWSVMDNPPTFLDIAFHTGGFINYANMSDPVLDKSIESARAALSKEAAKPFVQEAARRIHDQVYDVVMYVETFNIAHSDQWKGFQMKPSELFSIISPQSLASLQYAG